MTITGGRGTPIYNTNQSKNFTCGGGVLISDDNVPSVIRNCRITGNQARDMGGGISILTGNPTIRETTIDHNRAGANGGGIFVYSGDATILNTTITLNTLSGDGGVDGYKGGGGIAVFYSGIGGTCRVISSTVVSNDCCSKDHGSEICTQGQVSLDCSLVWNASSDKTLFAQDGSGSFSFSHCAGSWDKAKAASFDVVVTNWKPVSSSITVRGVRHIVYRIDENNALKDLKDKGGKTLSFDQAGNFRLNSADIGACEVREAAKYYVLPGSHIKLFASLESYDRGKWDKAEAHSEFSQILGNSVSGDVYYVLSGDYSSINELTMFAGVSLVGGFVSSDKGLESRDLKLHASSFDARMNVLNEAPKIGASALMAASLPSDPKAVILDGVVIDGPSAELFVSKDAKLYALNTMVRRTGGGNVVRNLGTLIASNDRIVGVVVSSHDLKAKAVTFIGNVRATSGDLTNSTIHGTLSGTSLDVKHCTVSEKVSGDATIKLTNVFLAAHSGAMTMDHCESMDFAGLVSTDVRAGGVLHSVFRPESNDAMVVLAGAGKAVGISFDQLGKARNIPPYIGAAEGPKLRSLDVKISGKTVVSLDVGTAGSVDFSVKVSGDWGYDLVRSLRAGEYLLSWDISPDIKGITISQDGVVRISSDVAVGVYSFDVIATARSGDVIGSADVRLRVAVLNIAPVLEQSSYDVRVSADKTATLTVKHTAGTSLTWGMTGNPGWVTSRVSGDYYVLTISPDLSIAGQNFSFDVTASNDRAIVRTRVRVFVSASYLLSLGVKISGDSTLSVDVGRAGSVDYNVGVIGYWTYNQSRDLSANEYALSWDITPDVDGITISSAGVLRVSSTTKAGVYSLDVIATARSGDIRASDDVMLRVAVLNVAPLLEQNSYDVKVSADHTATLTVRNTAGPALTWSISGSPSWVNAIVSGDDYVLTISPVLGVAGRNFSFTITASNNVGSSSAVVRIAISAIPSDPSYHPSDPSYPGDNAGSYIYQSDHSYPEAGARIKLRIALSSIDLAASPDLNAIISGEVSIDISAPKAYNDYAFSLDVEGLPNWMNVTGSIDVRLSHDMTPRYNHKFTLSGTPPHVGLSRMTVNASVLLSGTRVSGLDAKVSADLSVDVSGREIVRVISLALDGPETLKVPGSATFIPEIDAWLTDGRRIYGESLKPEDYVVEWELSGDVPEGVSLNDGELRAEGLEAGEYVAEIVARVSVELIDETEYTGAVSKSVRIVAAGGTPGAPEGPAAMTGICLTIGPGIERVNDFLDTIPETDIEIATGLILGPDIRDISGLERMPVLEYLDGEGYELGGNIVLSDDLKLKYINLRNCGIYSLRVCESVVSLDCGENHLLMLDLEGYGELEEVKCEGQTREINAGEIGRVEDLGLSDPERVESFEQLGDAVVYEYRTGFRDVMMDVTLREFGLGGHGGCNFGTGILSMIVLWLFAKRR